MLAELLDDAIEPLVHAAQFCPHAIDRVGEAHRGRAQILVAGVVAGELDTGLGELGREVLGLRKRNAGGGVGGIRFRTRLRA
jgi:hypothetical protein